MRSSYRRQIVGAFRKVLHKDSEPVKRRWTLHRTKSTKQLQKDTNDDKTIPHPVVSRTESGWLLHWRE